MEARGGVAFANTLSGVVMTVSITTAQHAVEPAMSTYRPDLSHGADLIIYQKHSMNFSSKSMLVMNVILAGLKYGE